MKSRVAIRLLKSAAIGILVAIAGAVLSFVLVPILNSAVMLYVAPGQILLPVVGRLIPTSALYRLFPEGGAPAGLFLILGCGILFWTVVFGVAHFAWCSMNRSKLRADN